MNKSLIEEGLFPFQVTVSCRPLTGQTTDTVWVKDCTAKQYNEIVSIFEDIVYEVLGDQIVDI